MEESQELEYKDISNSPGVNKSACDEESVTMNEWPELIVENVGSCRQALLGKRVLERDQGQLQSAECCGALPKEVL